MAFQAGIKASFLMIWVSRLVHSYIRLGATKEVEVPQNQIEIHNRAAIIYNEGTACHSRGDLQCSLDRYTRALSVLSETPALRLPEAHQNLGLILKELGDWEGSITHTRLSVDHARDDAFRTGSLMNLATVLTSSPAGKCFYVDMIFCL